MGGRPGRAGIAAALGCLLCYALLLLTGWLRVVEHSGGVLPGQDLALALTCPLVAAALLARQPGNRVGQLLMLTGVGTSVVMLSSQYGTYALHDRHGRVPGGTWALWLSNWIWVLGFSGIVLFLTLLFPSGRLASLRWRPVARLNVGLAVALALVSALHPGPLDDHPQSPVNPIGVPVLTGYTAAFTVLFVVSLLSALASIGGLIMRMRGATGVERAQLKWFAYSATIAVVTLLLGGFGFAVSAGALIGKMLELVSAVALGALPVAIGIGVLRYRLYEIDRLVSRTVSYATVTGSLLAVYVVLVTLVSRITPRSSSLAVAVSTLAVAALFQPVRRRVQAGVDRRFNRARYDADQTVEAFTRRLRSQVDLDAVRDDLLSVVRHTMEPAAVGVWLREPPGASR